MRRFSTAGMTRLYEDPAGTLCWYDEAQAELNQLRERVRILAYDYIADPVECLLRIKQVVGRPTDPMRPATAFAEERYRTQDSVATHELMRAAIVDTTHSIECNDPKWLAGSLETRREALRAADTHAAEACGSTPPNVSEAVTFQQLEAEVRRLRGEVSALQYAVQTRVVERDQARAFAEHAVEKHNELLASTRVTCAYCGHQYAEGTPDANSAALTEHIALCPIHPMRQVRAERDQALAEIDRLRAVLRGWHDAWKSGHGQDCTSGCYDMDRETIRALGIKWPNAPDQRPASAGPLD